VPSTNTTILLNYFNSTCNNKTAGLASNWTTASLLQMQQFDTIVIQNNFTTVMTLNQNTASKYGIDKYYLKTVMANL